MCIACANRAIAVVVRVQVQSYEGRSAGAESVAFRANTVPVRVKVHVLCMRWLGQSGKNENAGKAKEL